VPEHSYATQVYFHAERTGLPEASSLDGEHHLFAFSGNHMDRTRELGGRRPLPLLIPAAGNELQTPDMPKPLLPYICIADGPYAAPTTPLLLLVGWNGVLPPEQAPAALDWKAGWLGLAEGGPEGGWLDVGVAVSGNVSAAVIRAPPFRTKMFCGTDFLLCASGFAFEVMNPSSASFGWPYLLGASSSSPYENIACCGVNGRSWRRELARCAGYSGMQLSTP